MPTKDLPKPLNRPKIHPRKDASNVALNALDVLALALLEHKHCWTPKQRSLYEKAVAELEGKGS